MMPVMDQRLRRLVEAAFVGEGDGRGAAVLALRMMLERSCARPNPEEFYDLLLPPDLAHLIPDRDETAEVFAVAAELARRGEGAPGTLWVLELAPWETGMDAVLEALRDHRSELGHTGLWQAVVTLETYLWKAWAAGVDDRQLARLLDGWETRSALDAIAAGTSDAAAAARELLTSHEGAPMPARLNDSLPSSGGSTSWSREPWR